MQKTCLNAEHRKRNAKLIDFGGWEMPVQYPAGILAEHEAVRTDVGICDASHMGQVFVRGNGAREFVNHLVTNDISAKQPGQATYSLMCNHSGGAVDDLIVYVIADDEILLVVNGSRRREDLTWIDGVAARHPADARVEPAYEGRGLIAVQGPRAEQHLQRMCDADLADVKSFRFLQANLLDKPALLSRTGYTGEDGFEVMGEADHVVALWQALIEGGASPTGLGSRDTLRQEMGFPLYGNDLDQVTTPLEASLRWAVKLEKSDFVGKEALQHQLETGIPVQRVGILSNDRGIPRHGCQVYLDTHRVGYVSSGCFSPTLKQGIGQAFIDPELTKPGTVVEIEIRNRRHRATVTRMPFYQRGPH